MNVRRLAVVVTALAAVVLGSVGLTLLAGGGGGDADAGLDRDPHAGGLPADELNRLLRATDAAANNRSKADLVADGRRIFRDDSVALTGESCQSCHTEGSANPSVATTMHPAAGVADDFTGPRDAPALWGSGRTAPYFWNGDFARLDATIVQTIMTHFKPEARGDPARVGEMTAALEAYLRQLDPPSSPFDRGTMAQAALDGEVLFQGKAGCIVCHGGPLFTDNRIHNTGVPLVGPMTGRPDRGGPTPPGEVPIGPDSPTGAFINTPMLRDLESTAPYMHNGAFETLADVVAFYNTTSTLSPLNLTAAERADLVAFLESL